MRLFRRRARPAWGGFLGDWNYRIGDLFRCGVDFRDRTVLDAGCNMGILAYEIAKHEPRSIHGIDSHKDYIRTAQMIFLGSAVEARFDRANLSRARELANVLLPRYDVVLFLSVYHHVRNAHGAEAAAGATRTLLQRCARDFILRLPPHDVPEIEQIILGEGFARTFTGDRIEGGKPDSSGRDSRFYAYRRKPSGR
jgi:hypothetical protein